MIFTSWLRMLKIRGNETAFKNVVPVKGRTSRHYLNTQIIHALEKSLAFKKWLIDPQWLQIHEEVRCQREPEDVEF